MRNTELRAELDVRDHRTRLSESAADKMAAALAMLWHVTPADVHQTIREGFDSAHRWQARRKKEQRPTNNQVSYGRGKKS